MKSLNRTLSLVLVLVMVFGLFGVASAASFKDDSTIQYKEAVDVMTGIGAINGYTDGTFAPKGTITREEAAKLVTYSILGADIAKTLSVSNSSFKDVEATRWSAPFIAYLVSKGIINGVGDGKFDPTGNVTGYQLAKMLLCAAGYGVNAEYTGSSWELNVAIDANKNGVFTGSKATSFSTAATREEAALYCFNAITKVELVVWDKNKSTYVQKDEDGTKACNISTVVYPTLKSVDATIDSFGRPAARSWQYKTADISTVFSATPVATFTTPVTYSQLWNTLGCTSSSNTVNTYVNGVAKADVVADQTDVTTTIGGYGVTTELYKYTSGATVKYTAVMINNVLAKVTAVTAYKAATATTAEVKASVTLDVYAGAVAASKTFETTGFAKGDYVVVTLATGVVKSAVAAKSMDGIMTAYATGSITVSGTKLPICASAWNMYSANLLIANQASIGFTSTYTYYLDANNAVIGTTLKTAAVPTSYAFVSQVEYKNDAGSLVGSSALAAKAKVIFTDGTAAVVDMAITNAGTTAAPDYKTYMPKFTVATGVATCNSTSIVTAAAANVGCWYAYTKNADGAYVFSLVNTDYATIVAPADSDTDGSLADETAATLAAKTTTAIGGKYTTSATTVTAVDAAGVKSSFVGYPTTALALKGVVLYTYAKDASVISGVYAVGQDAVAASVTYAYAVKAGNTTAYGQEWIFSINGAQVTNVIAAADVAEMGAGKVFTLTSAANSTYTVEEVSYTVTLKTVTVADSTLFVAGGATYTYGTTYGVYNVDVDNTTIGSKDTVAVGDVVSVIVVGGYAVATFITTEYVG